eukprot:CAMPEP_0182563800 /NCGR_PEP_ID=MMETSP1324-20130603/5876_1 /TAXON_ID=236786 /ORGANISM="Florenciella sp., Strain RCC1587" /LENGTH=227 /DNA_ID=CAMNT_0024777099 /DNA_START=48 /DNA_END=731 /DNA_ORIENTATION=-
MMRVLLLVSALSAVNGFTTTNSWVTRTAPAVSRAATRRAVAMDVDKITSDAETKMKKSLDSVQSNLDTLRAGRASANLLDRVVVDYYGAETPLNQLAGISVTGGQALTIDPYDKSTLGDIERALMESDLGMTPNNNGETIRLNIPALTEDRRKELSKTAKSLGEDGKTALRNVRRDAVDKVKKLAKAGDISEDQGKDGEDAVQKMTDKYVKEIETVIKKKEADIMKV